MVGWSPVSKNMESKIMESSYICEEGTATSTADLYQIFTEQKILATLLD